MMISEIAGTNLFLSGDPLPFEVAHKSRIDVFWEQAYAANPRLWNGPFFLFSDVHIDDQKRLCGLAHRTDFATFLYWRDMGRDPSVTHITATSFPRLDDGSLLAIRMATHTANANRVYFPSGSFDARDLKEGKFDAIESMRREMREEIGVTLDSDWFSGPVLTLTADYATYVTRLASVPYRFHDIEKKWRKHQKNGGDDEVAGLVQINSLAQLPKEIMSHARYLCDYYFNQVKQG